MQMKFKSDFYIRSRHQKKKKKPHTHTHTQKGVVNELNSERVKALKEAASIWWVQRGNDSIQLYARTESSFISSLISK